MNNQETISFTRDFLEFLNLHGSLKQLDKKIQTFLDNEKTL